MATIFLTNLGCKLNQAELEAYARRFESDGHRLVDGLEKADVHVVNTCTVTHVAARDSRKIARRGSRLEREVKTVLTGCYATEKPEEANSLPGVELVVDNAEKDDLVEKLYSRLPELRPSLHSQGNDSQVPVWFVPLEYGNTRGAIKVEDGCNMTCAYCIIPSTRGRQRSRTVAEIVDEMRLLGARGYQEIVVTGVQISSYRDGSSKLYELTKALLEGSEIPRLRLTSIAPWQFDRRLLDLWPNQRLCRHFHLSLQSGNDEVLRRMRRPYTTQQYLDLLAEIRSRISGVAITTDVIVGFPGESETEFERSLDFVASAGFARTHVFPYSERDGTLSAEMEDSVSPQVKKERVAAMRKVAAASASSFARSQVGSAQQVLWEHLRPAAAGQAGVLVGTTDNYLRVEQLLASGSREEERAAALRVGTLQSLVPAAAVAERLVFAQDAGLPLNGKAEVLLGRRRSLEIDGATASRRLPVL